MNYCELQPAGPIARRVKCFWMLEGGAQDVAEQRIVPDGRPELIFNLATPFERQTDTGWKLQPRRFVTGQITGPLLLRAIGPVKILGIRFQPHGARELLGVNLDELTDSAVPLDNISSGLDRRLQAVHDATSTPDALSTLSSLLSDLCWESNDGSSQLAAAVARLEQTNGAADIADVAHYVGLSSRQLQRQFRESVGISPKLFSRMQRFQRVFQQMQEQPLTWVETAVECGYYDQAHLIRDFREFAGKAPTSLTESEVDLARRFLTYHSRL